MKKVLVIILISIGCSGNKDISKDPRKFYLLNTLPTEDQLSILTDRKYDIISVEVDNEKIETLSEITLGNDIGVDFRTYPFVNHFIDPERKNLLLDGYDHLLLFDYKEGGIIDSISLDYPFTTGFNYSSKYKIIFSYLNTIIDGSGNQEGILYSINLNDRQIKTEKVNSTSCGVANQGINNRTNTFFNYGCDHTTLYHLDTKSAEIIDHYELDLNNPIKWGLLWGLGLTDDHKYLFGFGLYQRHFPDDPDFTGTYDSIRNELYIVRKNLIDGSFIENRVDTNFGMNNGYLDTHLNAYVLKHNDEVILFNYDLTTLKKFDLSNTVLLKK